MSHPSHVTRGPAELPRLSARADPAAAQRGQDRPARGKPLDLAALGFPASPRRGAREVARRARRLRAGRPGPAPPRCSASAPPRPTWSPATPRCATRPTARADRIYTGVLYDALDLATLSPGGQAPRGRRLAVDLVALRRCVRPGDRIPAYRLSGDATCPGSAPVAGALARRTSARRSPRRPATGCWSTCAPATYAAVLAARRRTSARARRDRPGAARGRAAERTVVSHFNKATKGRLVRALLEDGAAPATPRGARRPPDATRLDGRVGPADAGTRLDVVVHRGLSARTRLDVVASSGSASHSGGQVGGALNSAHRAPSARSPCSGDVA